MSDYEDTSWDYENQDGCIECPECGSDACEPDYGKDVKTGKRVKTDTWICEDCGNEWDEGDDDERDYPHPGDEDYPIDGVGYANPGGRSAFRAATRDNPRDQDCPTCGAKNVLTRIDQQRGYQCDRCAMR